MKKTVLITGAGDGIGKGIAVELAKSGFDLMIHSARNIDKAERLCAGLTEEYGCRAYCVRADLMDASAPDAIFDAFDSHFDTLDLYVNNAGVTEGAPFLNLTEETFDRVVTINFKGAFFCTQNAAKRMVKKGTKGNIILISSNLQDVVGPRVSVYGPVKSALSRFARHISIELAQFGIRVNSIAPGYVDSSERMQGGREASMPYIPLRKWANVGEIGQAVLFIESAPFMTGHCLVIDGGASCRYYPMELFEQDVTELFDE